MYGDQGANQRTDRAAGAEPLESNRGMVHDLVVRVFQIVDVKVDVCRRIVVQVVKARQPHFFALIVQGEFGQRGPGLSRVDRP